MQTVMQSVIPNSLISNLKGYQFPPQTDSPESAGVHFHNNLIYFFEGGGTAIGYSRSNRN